MKLCEFIRPASLDDARDKLRELGPQGMAIAGGTALHLMQDNESKTGVDITRLGLSFIRREGSYYVVGATTPLADIQRYRAPDWTLHEVCRRIATHQIRNISTIGGNICRVFPWADLPVVLLALDARMVVYSGKDEEIASEEFFKGQPAQRFAGGDILTAVKVPAFKAHQGFGVIKAARNSAAFSLVTVAASVELDGDKFKSVRIAVGGAVPFPQRLPSVEAALVGREATSENYLQAAAKAADDANWRGRESLSPEYIRGLAEVSIHDALERAVAFARTRNA
jgi:CO/xanthine dehydrogenase FAD-binding subunit